MDKKRITVLAKILEEEKLQKMAQEVGAGENNIDETTADKLAHDIFNQLFDDEINKIINQS